MTEPPENSLIFPIQKQHLYTFMTINHPTHAPSRFLSQLSSAADD